MTINEATELAQAIENNIFAISNLINSRNNPTKILEYAYVKRFTELMEKQLVLYKKFLESVIYNDIEPLKIKKRKIK